MSNQFVQLKDNGNELFPKSLVIGIDTTNVIAENVPFPYTASEDCVVVVNCYGSTDLFIDGVSVMLGSFNVLNYVPIYAKKGQTLNNTHGYSNVYKVFGLKYI